MDNTVDIISGISPTDRAGENEVFSEIDSCKVSCDLNLRDNCQTNLETDDTLILCTLISVQVGTVFLN